MAKQPEDLMVGVREKKEKYMQWEQGCCQHVQGWNLERQGVDAIKHGKE